MNNSKINIPNYYDCFEQCIAFILQSKGYDYSSFFNNNGLIMREDRENNLFHLSNKLSHDLSNNYKEKNGVFYQGIESNTFEYDVDYAPILLKVDAYYLPYCRSYQKQHHIHFLVLLKKEMNEVTVYDPFYNYKGKILINNLNLSRKSIEELYVEFSEHHEYKILVNDNLIRNINHNLDVILKYHLDLMTNPDIDLNNGYKNYFGLEAIKHIKDVISYYYLKNSDVLSDIATGINTIANSRRQVSEYYKKFGQSKLVDLYFQGYQKWKILFNTILKIIITQDKELLGASFSVLEEIYTVESKIINLIRETLYEPSM